MQPVTTQQYLAGLDTHLATIESAIERVAIIEEEIRRTDLANRRLERWAWRGGKRPTPFSAIELTTITLELSKRLIAARNEAGAHRVAAE